MSCRMFLWLRLALAMLAGLLPVMARATIFNIADGDVAGPAGLIAAINAANTATGADTINLAPNGTYTLVVVDNTGPGYGPTGMPRITSQITLNGNGATIQRSGVSGTPDFRIIMIAGGDLLLNQVTIRNGRAAAGLPSQKGGGGGIRNDSGTLVLVRCTVAQNSSSFGPGALANGGGGILNNDGGQLTVVNSTLSGNTGYWGTLGVTGGGILNLSDAGVSKTTILNSTLFENIADGPPGFQGIGDAIADASSPPGSILVKNSILASPTQGLGVVCSVAAGSLTSLGHNIVGDNSALLAFTGPGDQNNTDPLLDPLGFNGGPTWTHLPQPGSPAIDALPVTDCADDLGIPITVDQRGLARPQGPDCDIGSVEACGPGVLLRPPQQNLWVSGGSGNRPRL